MLARFARSALPLPASNRCHRHTNPGGVQHLPPSASEPPNEPRGNNFTTALLVGVGKCDVKCPKIPRNEQKSLCFILLVAVSHTRGCYCVAPCVLGEFTPCPAADPQGGPSWFWQLSKSPELCSFVCCCEAPASAWVLCAALSPLCHHLLPCETLLSATSLLQSHEVQGDSGCPRALPAPGRAPAGGGEAQALLPA